jgi:VanZ family protein
MKLKYISWLPAIGIMGAIFWFSSKTAQLSQESSLSISIVIYNLYDKMESSALQGPEKLDLLAFIDHIVRKSAHFTEYALLSASIAFHYTVWKKSIRYRTWLPVLIAGLYAASDEFHQTFVAGRSGQVSDVLLDTAGATAGVLVFSLLYLLILRHKKNRTKIIG